MTALPPPPTTDPPPPGSPPPPHGPAPRHLDTGEAPWAQTLRTLPPDRPWMRWAWILLGTLFAVPLLLMGTFQIVSLLAHEEETRVQTFAADGVTTIDVEVSSGSITVIATNDPTITVTARISRGLTTTDHSETLDGDTVRLRAYCNHVVSKFCGVDYTIEAPADVIVLARTEHSDIDVTGTTGGVTARTENGSVTTTEVSGMLDLRSENGSITAEIVQGSLRAHTDNGSLRASFREPPDDVFASSANGSVLVVVPDTDDAYALDVSSDNGRTTGAVRTDPASPRRITAHSDNGSVTVRYP